MAFLDLQHHDNVIVAILTGELTLANAQTLREALEQAITTDGVTDIALDLARVSYLDSSGLGSLIAASTRARAAGCRILLYRPSREVHKLLDAAQLSGLFPVLEDEEDLLTLLPD